MAEKEKKEEEKKEEDKNIFLQAWDYMADGAESAWNYTKEKVGEAKDWTVKQYNSIMGNDEEEKGKEKEKENPNERGFLGKVSDFFLGSKSRPDQQVERPGFFSRLFNTFMPNDKPGLLASSAEVDKWTAQQNGWIPKTVERPGFFSRLLNTFLPNDKPGLLASSAEVDKWTAQQNNQVAQSAPAARTTQANLANQAEKDDTIVETQPQAVKTVSKQRSSKVSGKSSAARGSDPKKSTSQQQASETPKYSISESGSIIVTADKPNVPYNIPGIGQGQSLDASLAGRDNIPSPNYDASTWLDPMLRNINNNNSK